MAKRMEGNKGRFYYSIQPTLKHTANARMGRRDTVVITRLKLGHCTLKHGLALVGKHPDGKCTCGEGETVKHALMECTNYHTERSPMQAELSETGVMDHSLKSILNAEHCETTKTVINVLHRTGLYIRI